MKHSPLIGSSEVENVIQLKHKINSFKHHILNLQKTYARKFQKESDGYDENICFRQRNSGSGYYEQESRVRSNLFNRYQKEKLKNITNENNLLLYKMIKIDEGHSKYNDPSFRHTFSQMRNNFLISKFNDRKRSLSEIMKSNKKLNTKLTRCASSQKLSECGKWKQNWIRDVKSYSQNLSKKFPKISYDFRNLAYRDMQKEPKPFNKLRLKLDKRII